MAKLKKRPVALVDVDQTLVFGDGANITYNDNLIASLKNHGITDIYLFSSMTTGTVDIENIKILKEYLERQGIAVHRVISPADLVWHNHQLAIDFNNKLNIYLIANQTADQKAIQKEVKRLLSTREFIALNYFSGALPGAAYSAITAPKGKPDNDVDAQALAMTVANIRQNRKKVYSSQTADMLHMFQKNIPKWVGSIVVIDGADENIDAIKEITADRQYQTPVIAIHSSIETRKELTENEYHEKFAEFRELALEQKRDEIRIRASNVGFKVGKVVGSIAAIIACILVSTLIMLPGSPLAAIFNVFPAGVLYLLVGVEIGGVIGGLIGDGIGSLMCRFPDTFGLSELELTNSPSAEPQQDNDNEPSSHAKITNALGGNQNDNEIIEPDKLSSNGFTNGEEYQRPASPGLAEEDESSSSLTPTSKY